MSYANSCFSEYLGCHILNSIGIPAQETILGYYERDGIRKIVVACGDLESHGVSLRDFASLKNTVTNSTTNGYGTDLDDVLEAIHEQNMVNPFALEEHFWNLFIADTFIGNWERHNGNWGFLYNSELDTLTISPTFDCGSSLYPQADENIMQSILEDKAELNMRIYERPTSALSKNGKRIRYFDFISSLEYPSCNDALVRMIPHIDMSLINNIIDNMPIISELQKDFYKVILKERKEKILDFSLSKLQNRKAIRINETCREKQKTLHDTEPSKKRKGR